MWQKDRHKKKMRGGVFSKNVWEGAKERASDEIKIYLV